MKRNNIILEGVDGSGKTAIAKVLEEQRDYNYIHFTNPPKNMPVEEQKDYMKQQCYGLLDLLNFSYGNVIDRYHLGEAVYAPLKRGYYPNYLVDLETKIYPHNYLFLVKANLDVLNERFDDDFIRKEDLGYLTRKYDEEFKRSNFPNKAVVITSYNTPVQSANCTLHTVDNEYEVIKPC